MLSYEELSGLNNMLLTTTRIPLASRNETSCQLRRTSIKSASIRVEILGAMTATLTTGAAFAAAADAMTSKP